MNKQREISLDYLLASYLKHHILRPSSVKNYRNGLNRLSREKNITLLSEITEDLLVSWKNEVLQRATATTWNNYHSHLRALLNFALKKGWVDKNVLLNISRARKPKLKKKTIDLTSLELIFRTLDQHEEQLSPKWFWRAVIKLMFHTGAGKGSEPIINMYDINEKISHCHYNSFFYYLNLSFSITTLRKTITTQKALAFVFSFSDHSP